MTEEIDLPESTLVILRDHVARESLAGRAATVDGVAEDVIIRTLDAAERGEWSPSMMPPPAAAETQANVVERVRENMRAKIGGRHTRVTCGELAARAAHDEGLSYREAALRFGSSISNVGYHYKRLFPGERSIGRRPTRANHFDGGGQVGSGQPDPSRNAAGGGHARSSRETGGRQRRRAAARPENVRSRRAPAAVAFSRRPSYEVRTSQHRGHVLAVGSDRRGREHARTHRRARGRNRRVGAAARRAERAHRSQPHRSLRAARSARSESKGARSMNALIALWIAVALVSMCMAPLVFDEFDIFDNLGIEGRAVLAIACAAVWPLFLVFGVLWVGRAFFIGLGQVWRMLVPAKAKLPKAKLPKAQVRR